MKRLLCAALLVTMPACETLQKGLTIIQDPAVMTLIHDLQLLIELIGSTAAQRPTTPAARTAMEAAITQQVDAAEDLIRQLRDLDQARAATRGERDLAAVLEPLRHPDQAPATP